MKYFKVKGYSSDIVYVKAETHKDAIEEAEEIWLDKFDEEFMDIDSTEITEKEYEWFETQEKE